MVAYINGRFRTDTVTIRKVGNLEIVFWDKEAIYLIDNSRGVRYIFHRWFAPRKSYNAWRSFRQALWTSNHEEIGWYFEESAIWDVPFTTTTRPVDFAGKKVKETK